MGAGKIIKRLLPLMLCMMMLTSCGNAGDVYSSVGDYYTESERSEEELGRDYGSKLDKIYKDTMENIADTEDVEELEGTDIFDKILRKFLAGYHRAYRVFRSLSTTIVICSVSIGVLIQVFSRENKRLKRTGRWIFMIGIPFVVFVIVFGVGALNSIFLY